MSITLCIFKNLLSSLLFASIMAISVQSTFWSLNLVNVAEQTGFGWTGEDRFTTAEVNMIIWAGDKQKLQVSMCSNRRLRSACASAQSDQSLWCVLYGQLQVKCFFRVKTNTTARLWESAAWFESWLYATCTLCWIPAHSTYRDRMKFFSYWLRLDWFLFIII